MNNDQINCENNLPIPFNWLSVPGAKIVSGADTINILSPSPNLDLSTGVPNKPYFLSPSNINVPKIEINLIINLIKETLPNIKKIIWEECEYYVFKIEYQPIEGVVISDDRKYDIKNIVALKTCLQALKMFPYLEDELIANIMEDIPNFPTKKYGWCKSELRIYYDNKTDKYVLELNRLRGDACSHYHIFRQIVEAFTEHLLL